MLSTRRLSTDWMYPCLNALSTLFSLCIAMVMGWGLPGCDSKEPQSFSTNASPESSSSQIASNEFPYTFTDRLNRKVTIRNRPERIISLNPSTTELLFAIGAESKLVGRTEYCNFPEGASKIPIVGKGTIEGISREAILAARPDVILFKWDSHQALIETFEPLGIPLIGIGPESVDELLSEAELLGRLTGTKANANHFTDRFASQLKRLQQLVADIAPSQRARVFYEVWDDPLMTAGPESFIGQLLSLANAENIFADVQARYPRVSREALVQRNPDVILAPTTHSQKVDVQKMALRPGWGEMLAVKNQRIHVIDGDLVSRCGPRMLSALHEIIRAVYPEVAPKLPVDESIVAPNPSGSKP
ncbi:Vitamin B12-binding protein precursor [Pirellula sp. SH-Sr6A]|uniref:ABC transporter substrate-binding protein n=1 Tax=Pirellula sp. SH-Sr6A TaxID=1632865 RepID=UPI00078DEC3B|nr:cobalamin-binding protein [Pirellula sp. SH-Sr6A]AMV34683.1 Vitamin B12-binding protein precursor [Pirellula sp. SH-Sr6A]